MDLDNKFDVVGFGALNVDLIYQADSAAVAEVMQRARAGTEAALSREEMYPLIQHLERFGQFKGKAGGGQAANTVAALSRMGFSCGYIGCVGDDEEGGFLIDTLESVDTSGVLHQGKSGVCLVVLDETGERTMCVFPNANDMISYGEVNADYASATEFVYFTSFVGDRPLDAQKKLAKEVGDRCRIALDPGELYASRGLDGLREIIERAEVVFATDSEIEALTGMDYQRGCQELLSVGATVVACKRGERGSHIVSADGAFAVAAEPVDVVDKTGAGDVYAAGFIAGLLRNATLEECAAFATRVAAKSITGYGRSRYPDESDLAHLQL
jgi:ribokinase